ncbi:MAG: hypothetical protein ACRDVP_06965 [Acidimicrobiales bacterium]
MGMVDRTTTRAGVIGDRVSQLTSHPAEPEDIKVTRFDPMLRTLMSFGLVERIGGAGGEWRLTAGVQQRLNALVKPQPETDRLIYFGHRCGSCGGHGPTMIVSGSYLCGTCRQGAALETSSVVQG